MELTITIDVNNCNDCPFRKSNRGHGECFEFCDHKEIVPGYDNILWGCQSHFEIVPEWCPLKLGGET